MADETSEQQQDAPKRVATKEHLLKKKPATAELTMMMEDDDGEDVELVLKFRALSNNQYEALIEEHPPSAEDKKNNSRWNSDTFPPALVAKTLVEPAMNYHEVVAIFESDDWNAGELLQIFQTALGVCMKGFNVPFSKRGSSGTRSS